MEADRATSTAATTGTAPTSNANSFRFVLYMGRSFAHNAPAGSGGAWRSLVRAAVPAAHDGAGPGDAGPALREVAYFLTFVENERATDAPW